MACFGKASWYSAMENITISQLFSDDFVPAGDCCLVDEFLTDYQVYCFVKWEESYHYKLGFIKNPPWILYCLWNKDLLDKDFLAVVWPRMMSSYGKKIVEALFEKVVGFNLVVISGGAEGVDFLAHKLAIDFWIPTIVVLGWGLAWHMKDSFYRDFFEEVLWGGWAIISEFKLFQSPTHYTFPQRNRIVAGLCDCLFIPEAKEKSGSLITADFAYSMNKPIYVVPWDFFSQTSRWVHRLVSEKKALLSDSSFDFLSQFFLKNGKISSQKSLFLPELTDLQKKIFDFLRDWGGGVSDLLNAWFDPSECYEALNNLEMYWLIKTQEFGFYVVV